MSRHKLTLPLLCCALLAAMRASAGVAICQDCPAHPAALEAAAKAAGIPIAPGKLENAQLLILQTGETNLTDAQVQTIAAFVHRGGALLVALGPHTGTGAFRLASLLPSTIWRVNGRLNDGTGPDGAIRAAEWDRAMFPADEPRGLELPYHFRIRPVDSVERGEGRYERFARTLAYLKTPAEPGNTFWTRPLINRDWQIRLRGSGVEQIPLLITGRYGAGRVALFASSLDAPGETAAFWTQVLNWLAAARPAPAVASQATFTVTPVPSMHGVHIVVTNPAGVPFNGEVIVRARTWERAITEDFTRSFSVAPHLSKPILIQLPKPSTQNYQALGYRDAYDLRIGLIAGGADLVTESTAAVDFTPPLSVAVHIEDIGAVEPLMNSFHTRLGMPIDRYAYHSGETISGSVTLRNGLRNIALLAQVRDETDPSNTSAAALNDEAAVAEKKPIDGIQAWGFWSGKAGVENVLAFHFAKPVTVSAVTLIDAGDNYRNYLRHNPRAALIEADGVAVAERHDLEAGQTRIEFAPRKASVIRVRLPYVSNAMSDQEPRLAEILIDGVADAPGSSGKVQLELRDTLSGRTQPLTAADVTVASGEAKQIHFSAQAGKPGYYAIVARYSGQESQTPVLVIDPVAPLTSILELRRPDAPQMGFIVTRGFRNIFNTGTGTHEELGGWGQPDDLIWAYSRQLKQIGRNARTYASRLYLSESDMRHYSTPWRSFADGEYLYDVGAPKLVEQMKKLPNWSQSDLAILGHSDRWDTAPDVDMLHGWQDFIDFDDYLRAQKLAHLEGKTRQQLADEIHSRYEALWQSWNLQRYQHGLEDLRTAFAAEQKKVIISAQGAPLVPMEYEDQIASIVRGESDDSTWGMIQESVPATTGRQMGVMAFNPAWAMSTLLQWNFDSGILNNPHWHAPAGTTEPSRRHLYDRAFRGVIRPDGAYHSMHTYAFGSNAGSPFTTTDNDWQQWWRMSDRHALIAPDGPLGAGIIISTARFSDPKSAAFSGSGGWGKGAADVQVREVSSVVRALHDAGVSVAFSGNAATLDKWKGDAPLILLDLCRFSDSEIAKVAALVNRGVRIAAFQGEGPLSASTARLFQSPNTLLIPGPADALTSLAALDLAPRLDATLRLPIHFAAGTSGYGFTSQGSRYIVLEDWREEGRTAPVKLLATPGTKAAHAVDANDHRALAVTREGDWWSIEVPLRPGDGTLVCVREEN
jgi:hypothetical protein